MILPRKNGPMENIPRMPPAIARPHAFRFTATIPPVSAKIERIHPMIPHVTKIDCSCSIVIGASGGSTLWSIEESSASADVHVNNPSNPAPINKIPATSGIYLGLVGC